MMRLVAILQHPLAIVLLALSFFAVASSSGTLSFAQLEAPAEQSFMVGSEARHTGTINFRGSHGSDERFVASWFYGKESEGFTIAATTTNTGLKSELYAYEYKLFVKERADKDWRLLKSYGPIEHRDRFGGTVMQRDERLQLDPWVTSYKGPTSAAVLRAELWIQVPDQCNRLGFGCSPTWRLAAVDGATLDDGRGSVELRKGQSNIVEEGELVDILVNTGAGGPWRLTVFDGNGNKACLKEAGFRPGFFGFFRDVRDTVDNLCRYTWTGEKNAALFALRIPAGAFDPGGENKWSVLLENSITAQSATNFFTVDKKELIPEPPRVGVECPTCANQGTTSDGKPIVEFGKDIILTATGRSNPETLAPIKEFRFDVWCGDRNVMPVNPSPSWIVFDQRVPAVAGGDGSYSASLTFRPDKSCDLAHRTVAVDEAGRPSGSKLNEEDRGVLEEQGLPDANDDSEGEIDVEGPEKEAGGTSPGSKDEERPFPYLLVILGGVLGIVSVLYLPVPMAARYVVVLVVGAVVALGIWGGGA